MESADAGDIFEAIDVVELVVGQTEGVDGCDIQ